MSFLSERKRPVFLSQINDALDKTMQKGDFVRSCLALLASKNFVLIAGSKQQPQYTLIGDYDSALAFLKETYSDIEAQTPADTQKYYELYGFDKFVASVSKWIDHENTTQREYDIDRLWIGRYIDFLDKAKEYAVWRESEQAIAHKKLKELKEINAKALKK